jgi:predicted MPP superfamily phosphohydrolase
MLLAHQPSTAAAAAAAGYDVQLSGHTHGGQFWPWSWLVRYFQPFTHGLNRLKNLSVYVSRGTGYWGPPNRFIVPAEITRIRLVAA